MRYNVGDLVFLATMGTQGEIVQCEPLEANNCLYAIWFPKVRRTVNVDEHQLTAHVVNEKVAITKRARKR